MSEEKLLTVRDASLILGISEKEVVDLAENGSLPAYKIGGVYLRFKKEQIEQYRKRIRLPAAKLETHQKNSWKDRISDFLYFNDFYILAILVVILLMAVILRGY